MVYFPHQEPDAPKRICKTTCKRQYKLNDHDLSLLDCTRVRNPHCETAAPMQLYFEEQVAEAARLKAKYEGWEYEERIERFRADHSARVEDWLEEVAVRKQEAARAVREQRAAEARRAKDAARAQRADEAAQIEAKLDAYVASVHPAGDFTPRRSRRLRRPRGAADAEAAVAASRVQGRPAGAGRRSTVSGADLPLDVLFIVMRKVARTLEPRGLRGPECVCQDLCNAAAACKVFRAAAGAGFEELAQLLAWKGWSRDTRLQDAWEKVVRDPRALKAGELRELARCAGLSEAGVKTRLAVRVLTWLCGCQPPGPGVSGTVLLAVQRERESRAFPQRLDDVSARMTLGGRR